MHFPNSFDKLSIETIAYSPFFGELLDSRFLAKLINRSPKFFGPFRGLLPIAQKQMRLWKSILLSNLFFYPNFEDDILWVMKYWPTGRQSWSTSTKPSINSWVFFSSISTTWSLHTRHGFNVIVGLTVLDISACIGESPRWHSTTNMTRTLHLDSWS